MQTSVTYSDVSTQDPDASLIAHYNYTITRTWKVTDVAGKFTTHNQVITVTDNTAPTFTQPVDIAINCDASILPANTGDVTAADMADNCAPDANLVVTYSDVSTQDPDASLIAHYNYTITRTWKVTDVAGKFTTHNQVITVTDNTAPYLYPACRYCTLTAMPVSFLPIRAM